MMNTFIGAVLFLVMTQSFLRNLFLNTFKLSLSSSYILPQQKADCKQSYFKGWILKPNLPANVIHR